MTPQEYIEIAGQVAITVIADTFAFGIGVAETPLPPPQGGWPSNYQSPGAKKEAAWVPIIEPEDAVESDGGSIQATRQAIFTGRYQQCLKQNGTTGGWPKLTICREGQSMILPLMLGLLPGHRSRSLRHESRHFISVCTEQPPMRICSVRAPTLKQ